ncbi:hypothetical protein PIB30_024748 [Stylosanthes scabra]|uniref:Uncharacterized protein n=1 Tax=Stylosanthes scabra TaxID=79078 RepID=A0ABU6T9K6_9FABA|nr:hypothetical protein [Stylosanthes scabra]
MTFSNTIGKLTSRVSQRYIIVLCAYAYGLNAYASNSGVARTARFVAYAYASVSYELHFKWVNSYYMSCLGPLRYGLIETDGQLKALCGVLDKEKMDSMELSESKFKGCNGLLRKLHNNKAKIGWANRVWGPGKGSMDHHWEVTHCMGALRSLNLPGNTNFKHWWGFKDEFKHKPP